MPKQAIRSRHRLRFAGVTLLAPALLLFASRVSSQPPQPAPEPAQGVIGSGGAVVTGRAVCADTQRAARFAQVTLIPATEDNDSFGRGRRLSARTDLDGNFSIADVAPGDYYVTGQLTGYVNEANLVQAALGGATGAPPVPANVPKIRVGTAGAAAQLSLQRGGVVAGSVQWDDGSPAAGVQISAVPATGASAAPPAGFGPFNAAGFGGPGSTQTDDRGRFRVSGLAPGAYLVRASVQAPAPATAAGGGDRRGSGRSLSLNVYAPDKLRRSDALTVTLAPGEERDDLAIILKLNILHSVTGTVSSTGAAVRSGTVRLTDQNDSSLTRSGILNPDGTFVVPYVPPGNYTLQALASSLAPSYGRGGGGQSSTDSTVHFQPLQESITVTDSDLTGLSLNVSVATTGNNTASTP